MSQTSLSRGENGRARRAGLFAGYGWFLSMVFFLLAALLMGDSVLAQCAMCRTAVENSQDVATTAQTLNTAILILLLPPVAIMSAIFVMAFRGRETTKTE